MTVTAVDKDMINIWIADAIDASPSDCIKTGTPTGDQILPWKAEITNLAQSGGAAQTEQKVCFGGNQSIDKPRDELELSFDVTPTVENTDRWMKLFLVADTTNTGTYTTKSLPTDRTVFIEVYDSDNSVFHSYAWNNANVTTNDNTWSSEDGQTLSVGMKVPTDTGGVANYMYKKVAVTALVEWTALDGN